MGDSISSSSPPGLGSLSTPITIPPADPAVPPPPSKKRKLTKKGKVSKPLFGGLRNSVGLEQVGMKPAGLSDEAMDPQFAIELYEKQQKAEKADAATKQEPKRKAAVGRVQIQRKKVETLVRIEAHDDDGLSRLHPAKYLLPTPKGDPAILWALLPVERPVQLAHLEVSLYTTCKST